VNERRLAIEHETLVMIATQQPMAVDLRTLAAVLEIASELERIGDYAKGIARITIRMGVEPFVKPLIDIPRMAEKARYMLHRGLQAFLERDVELARAIPMEDDEMDSLYDQVFRELTTYIIVDPKLVNRATYLIWVAHNLERAADRVVNICERVIFMVTGEVVRLTVHGLSSRWDEHPLSKEGIATALCAPMTQPSEFTKSDDFLRSRHAIQNASGRQKEGLCLLPVFAGRRKLFPTFANSTRLNAPKSLG
jgi:phosphate transport system protein